MRTTSINKGDQFLCIRTVVMSDNTIAYRQGKVYTSDRDNCITDDKGNENHHWSVGDDSNFNNYFVDKEVFEVSDRYGKGIDPGRKVVVTTGNVPFFAEVIAVDTVDPSITCELIRPEGGKARKTFRDGYSRMGRWILGDVVLVSY